MRGKGRLEGKKGSVGGKQWKEMEGKEKGRREKENGKECGEDKVKRGEKKMEEEGWTAKCVQNRGRGGWMENERRQRGRNRQERQRKREKKYNIIARSMLLISCLLKTTHIIVQNNSYSNSGLFET